MRLEQTRHPTSSKKIDRTKKKETKGMYSWSSDNMAEWEAVKPVDVGGRPPLWAWINTPTFNRAYGTWDIITLQVQDQISFTLFEYIDFYQLHFLKTYTSMYIKLYKKQGITSIVPI